MLIDQRIYFSRDFAEKLARTLHTLSPELGPGLFVQIATRVGMDEARAVEFARHDRVSTDTPPDHDAFVMALRLVANALDGRKKPSKKN